MDRGSLIEILVEVVVVVASSLNRSPIYPTSSSSSSRSPHSAPRCSLLSPHSAPRCSPRSQSAWSASCSRLTQPGDRRCDPEPSRRLFNRGEILLLSEEQRGALWGVATSTTSATSRVNRLPIKATNTTSTPIIYINVFIYIYIYNYISLYL